MAHSCNFCSDFPLFATSPSISVILRSNGDPASGHVITGALQSPGQLRGEEDVHELGAVIGLAGIFGLLLPRQPLQVHLPDTEVPEGRDVHDASRSRRHHGTCTEEEEEEQ